MFLAGENKMTRKKKYSKEFKLDAVNLVLSNITLKQRQLEVFTLILMF